MLFREKSINQLYRNLIAFRGLARTTEVLLAYPLAEYPLELCLFTFELRVALRFTFQRHSGLNKNSPKLRLKTLNDSRGVANVLNSRLCGNFPTHPVLTTVMLKTYIISRYYYKSLGGAYLRFIPLYLTLERFKVLYIAPRF